MRIGLTGGRGVLGAHIRDTLTALKHDVILYSGDVRDDLALTSWTDGLNCVVHAAAIVPLHKVLGRISKAIAVNVEGTANVAGAAGKVPGCRFVYISSCHVYRSSAQPLSESDPLDPVSHYGLTKLQGEQWARTLSGDPLVIRVFSFFDARQDVSFLVPSLRERILNVAPNADLTIEGADNVRDIASARWLGYACARLIDLRLSGFINCGTGLGLKVIDIAQQLSVAMARPDINWRGRQDTPANRLVANNDKLFRTIADLSKFDLNEALNTYVIEATKLTERAGATPR